MKQECQAIEGAARTAQAFCIKALEATANDPRAAFVARKLWAVQWALRALDLMVADLCNDAVAYDLMEKPHGAPIEGARVAGKSQA